MPGALRQLRPLPFEASLTEVIVGADSAAEALRAEALPPFNAYSADGEVTGPGAISGTGSDVAIFGDSASAVLVASATAADTLLLADSAAAQAILLAAAADGVELADEASVPGAALEYAPEYILRRRY